MAKYIALKETEVHFILHIGMKEYELSEHWRKDNCIFCRIKGSDKLYKVPVWNGTYVEVRK